MEKDNLRVLSAQLNGSTDLRILSSKRHRIGNHFLNERNLKRLRNRLGAGACQNKPERGVRIHFLKTLQNQADTLHLSRVMSLIIRIYDLSFTARQHGDLRCC